MWAGEQNSEIENGSYICWATVLRCDTTLYVTVLQSLQYFADSEVAGWLL